MTVQLESLRDRLGGRRRARPGSSSVIGVVSGRGGSGVSLVAATLALRSAQLGNRTLLIDADPWLDVQRLWLGAERGRSLDTLRGSDAGAESMVTAVSGGFELLSFGGGEAAERDQRALVRRVPPIFSRRDVVVVDAGSRLESLERCLDLKVGSILIVSGVDAVALASTHALIKALASRSELQPVVLFNRVGPEEAAAGEAVLVEGARRFLETEPERVGFIPVDSTLQDLLGAGARLPESLAGSRLLTLFGRLMPRLQPWIAT